MSEQHPPNPRKTPFGAATSGRGFRPEPAGDVEPTDPTVHLGAGLCELEAHERLLLGAQSDRNRPVDRGRALGRLDCRLDEFFATRVAWLARWAAADDVGERATDPPDACDIEYGDGAPPAPGW